MLTYQIWLTAGPYTPLVTHELRRVLSSTALDIQLCSTGRLARGHVCYVCIAAERVPLLQLDIRKALRAKSVATIAKVRLEKLCSIALEHCKLTT